MLTHCQLCGRNQVRPNTTVNMMDKLGTFAGQQHQDLSPKYREKSLTWVGIEPTTSGLNHRCSTDRATRPDGRQAVGIWDKVGSAQAMYE